MEEKNFKKYFFWASLLIVSILVYFIIQDFLISIISAFVLAYLLNPIHKFLKKRIPNNLSAFISIIIIILLLVIPAYFLIKVLVVQITNVAKIGNIEKVYGFLKEINLPSEILYYVPTLIEKISSYSLPLVYYIIKYIPILILNLIITIFLTFYFLLDWDKLNKEIKNIIPFKNKDKIIKDFSGTAHNIVFGNLLISIIEFIISLIGFYLLGINYFIVLAFLVAITALIPLIGPGFVWVPVAIIKVIQGDYWIAFLVLILGLIIGLGVDFFLRTLIIGKKAKLHPAIVLIGVLGGVKLFGFFGFIIGPLILGFFINFIKATLQNKD